MIDKVISTIERYQMLKKGANVIVALSGGADSMALLSILDIIKYKYNLNLIAAHVNHGLRGNEALRDEEFVKEQCRKFGIELKILHVNIREQSSKTGEGIELCGRRIRYEFFNSIYKNATIATAHTLSDSLETMLFNLTRGSTLKGLCSIPPVRDNIVRPLIDCTRTEIENYCNSNNISFVTDSTNLKDDYTRNHIRHNVVPQLMKINPMLFNAYNRCLKGLMDDENYLNQESIKLIKNSEDVNGYKTEILLKAHIAIRKRALAIILFDKIGKTVESKHVESVDKLLFQTGKIQINKTHYAVVKSGLLFISYPENTISPWEYEFREGLIEIPSAEIEIEIVNIKDLNNIQNIHNNILDYSFDYDRIIGQLTIRSRKDGDKIRLLKRKCTKSLKKLFNEDNIAPQQRNSIAVISDNEGPLWIEGYGVAERCALCEETKKICLLVFRRANDA